MVDGARALESRSANARALNVPQHWAAGIDWGERTEALARVAGEFDGWAPELLALITDGEADPVARIIRSLPVGTAGGASPA